VATIATGVVSMRSYNHHTRFTDDDHSRRVIEAMIPVVAVIERMVIRAADDDLTGDVGTSETQ
jgi:hypothetical protein